MHKAFIHCVNTNLTDDDFVEHCDHILESEGYEPRYCHSNMTKMMKSRDLAHSDSAHNFEFRQILANKTNIRVGAWLDKLAMDMKYLLSVPLIETLMFEGP